MPETILDGDFVSTACSSSVPKIAGSKAGQSCRAVAIGNASLSASTFNGSAPPCTPGRDTCH